MKKKICITIMAVLAALFAVSTYFICSYFIQGQAQAVLYNDLAEQVEEATVPSETGATDGTEPEATESAILPELAMLYEQNTDLVGWITIADTNINYPVVQSVDNPNFYLKHAFDGSYSDYGCPYVQENCDIYYSDNIIIYGHHMKNGSMFCDLEMFKSESFWQAHPTIFFSTLTEKAEYEIVAVFKTVVYTNSEDAFRYYTFVNAESAEDFDSFINRCKALALYDTGVTAEYGDKLITLSTCEYSQTNGRLVLVAKKI
ncbi:MAG: class B sortase [Lachnospiraceae bacterium]|nr:class B sortase [Lachnospiraceae bacterium]